MLTLDQWKSKGAFFEYKGNAVFYIRAGAGKQTLLCLHGFPTASWDWYLLADMLTANFDVLFFDMLGFGFSAKPQDYPYSILDQADLCIALLNHLKIKDYHILAHDYGDTVAQELLARHLESKTLPAIQSICLLNGGLFPEAHQPLLIQKLLMSPLGFLVSKFSSERLIKKRFLSVFAKGSKPSEREWADFWSLITHKEGRKVMHLLIRYMAERKQHRERWVGALQQATIPLRLIDGADDPISGRHLAQHYQKLVPNPDVVLLEHIGHYPQIEAPEQVWEAFRAFHRIV